MLFLPVVITVNSKLRFHLNPFMTMPIRWINFGWNQSDYCVNWFPSTDRLFFFWLFLNCCELCGQSNLSKIQSLFWLCKVKRQIKSIVSFGKSEFPFICIVVFILLIEAFWWNNGKHFDNEKQKNLWFLDEFYRNQSVLLVSNVLNWYLINGDEMDVYIESTASNLGESNETDIDCAYFIVICLKFYNMDSTRIAIAMQIYAKL